MTETSPQCVLCLQVISPGENSHPVNTENGANEVHWECLLRTVVGGIGHLEDHEHWCNEVGDPDGGRTFRQSAIEAAAWMEEHGERANYG